MPDEVAWQGAHIETEITQHLFFALTEAKPFVFKMRVGHDETVRKLQQGC